MKKKNLIKLSAGVAGVIFGLLPAMGYAEQMTTLPNGAELSVQIDNPLDNEEFNVPVGQTSINVPIDGEANIGTGAPSIGLIVVVDASGSTDDSGGSCGTILNCEKQAVKELLSSDGAQSVGKVGIVRFSSGASTIISNATVAEALAAVDNIGNSSGGTQYSTGLLEAKNAADEIDNSEIKTKLVVFLSDGENFDSSSTAFDNALNPPNGLKVSVDTIYPFAIGENAGCAKGTNGNLDDMGDCQSATPEELATLLPNLLATQLQSVDVLVEGSSVPSTKTPSVPEAGPVTTEYNASAVDLTPGTYNICAEAIGNDSKGTDSVQQCLDIHLLQLTASPESAVNDLNIETSHTVTAEIKGGSGPIRGIDFVVSGQNSANGSVSTLPNNEVQFTYTVPKSCSSLGTDNITVSTEIGGQLVSIPLQKTWIDSTAPVVKCESSVNPAGKNKPKAPGKGGQGQNQDGFYKLVAEDTGIANCPLTLKLTDEEGFVFPGPFLIGDTIKYTQDDDTPQSQGKMGGKNSAVAWHLVGHGDLVVTASDPSGNQSSATCLVPTAPK